MRGVNGRLAVVERQSGAGMPPLARLAGKGCAQRRGGRRRERGVAPGQNGRLLRLQLDGFASAVIGGVGVVLLAGHDEGSSTPSPHFPAKRRLDVNEARGAQGLRASQGTCASTPAQPPARMVSVYGLCSTAGAPRRRPLRLFTLMM